MQAFSGVVRVEADQAVVAGRSSVGEKAGFGKAVGSCADGVVYLARAASAFVLAGLAVGEAIVSGACAGPYVRVGGVGLSA